VRDGGVIVKDVVEPFYRGARVAFRALSAADAPLYFEWLKMGLLSEYRPALSRLCANVVEVADFIGRRSEVHEFQEFEALALDQISGEPFGLVSVSAIDRFNAKAEFSAVFVSHRCTPMAGEALLAAVRLTFDHLSLHKLVFHTFDDNDDALRVLRRREFVAEGRLVEELQRGDGGRRDLLRFALLRRHYEASLLVKRLIGSR